MKIFIAQMNSGVGDFEGNFRKIKQFLLQAEDADLVIFPECALCGYPQQDLLDFPAFAETAEKYAARLIAEESNRAFIFGTVEKNRDSGRPLRNVAVFVDQGKLLGKYFKRLLPTYDVFDEDRFFEPGRIPLLIDFKGEKLAITICEDIWNEDGQTLLQNRYQQNPVADSVGAKVLINLSASPFEYAKVAKKKAMLSGIAQRHQLALIYANAVGANDGIIFDGRSYAWSAAGDLLAEGAAYVETGVLVDLSKGATSVASDGDEIASIYDALVLGIRDYCKKQGFTSTILGLSGGIDSAVVACLAIDALGAENVVTLLMPSRYTSAISNEDSIEFSKKTQNPVHLLPIEEVYRASLRTLEKTFEGHELDATEENLQARVRGMLLMSLSNKFGHLLLATGNKSELATGYTTLYGDMCGGIAPISDVYKMQVYALGREANRRWERIPERIFTRPPTAELRPNQTDQDRLPPYERLDKILKALIEDFRSPAQIATEGFEIEEVNQIARMVSHTEYKRFQMPLGLKISSKAFGMGRRMPIVQKFF